MSVFSMRTRVCAAGVCKQVRVLVYCVCNGMYVYIYMYVYVYVYIYIYVMCMCICMCIYVCIAISARMYVCAHIYMYLYVCINVFNWLFQVTCLIMIHVIGIVYHFISNFLIFYKFIVLCKILPLRLQWTINQYLILSYK